MFRRPVKIGVLAVGALGALGATAYATTLADPDSTLGVVSSTFCSIVHSIFG